MQKNNENGQEIDFARDSENPEYCCLLAAIRIYRRSLRLGMKCHHTMGVFYNKPGENSKKGGVKFVTDKLVAVHLRTCASIVLNIKKNNPELNRLSTHFIRVTAANLLHRECMVDSYIQKCLRWLSTEFLTYLRNTIYTADAHTKSMNINLGPLERQRVSYTNNHPGLLKRTSRDTLEPHESLVAAMSKHISL